MRHLKTAAQTFISNKPDTGGSRSAFVDQVTNKKYRFCEGDHWSDQFKEFPTIEKCKKQLNDSCFNRFRLGAYFMKVVSS